MKNHSLFSRKKIEHRLDEEFEDLPEETKETIKKFMYKEMVGLLKEMAKEDLQIGWYFSNDDGYREAVLTMMTELKNRGY